MKKTYVFLSLVLSLNFALAYTSKVDLLVQDIKFANTVENLSSKEMNARLIGQIQKYDITFEDLKSYLVESGNEELLYKIEVYAPNVNDSFKANNFNYSSELIKTFLGKEISAENGANYSGCGTVVALGATAIVGGIVLGLLALEENGYFDDCSGICVDNTNETRVRDLSIGSGVAGILGITLVLAGSSGC